jgi:thiol-disulfide isomerase/thioredoxin
MGVKEQINDFLSNHIELRTNMGIYNLDEEEIKSIKEAIEDIEIKVFTGSWCPDCRLQVPRFFSIIMALGDEDFSLEIIDVSRDMNDENNLTEILCVMAIPTFIFFKKGEELGRIIERPKGRMEEDILEILE